MVTFMNTRALGYQHREKLSVLTTGDVLQYQMQEQVLAADDQARASMTIVVRPGDLLLVNNHEIIHGNTPIVCQEGSERISLVCYLREGMLNLGSKEYEDHRFNFVESRRKNKEHPLHKKLWNGVSEGMWNSNEWYNYLKANGGDEMVRKYHPEAFETVATLDDIWS
jgi:hypothetical protein